VPPPPKKIALEAATSFALGKAELTAEGKAAVDKEVLSKLGGFSRIESISVEGHADPMGNEAANVTLSKNRAEAVKAYMVSKGVKADLISTVGKGSSDPVPGVKCDPKMAKAKLVACNAPHRRIEVDVKGEAK
jgi:OOP family OmpA-OmpF porin